MTAPFDTKLNGREAMVSGGRSWWLQCGILIAVCALVIGVYAFGAQSGVLESLTPNAADTYYNLLVQGFRAGQLSLKKEAPSGLAQLADPYDPAANAVYRPESNTLHDMSYYKGRLYLYFGVTPALILFWPFAALTGHYLFHRQAVVIFCALGFLASTGLLWALWRRYFAGVSVGVVAAGTLALGLATGMTVLLPQSEVYEVPISCGYMLTMLALGAVWCALHEPERRWRWLAAASLAYGLAVGARPNLLFGAVILLVPVAQGWRERRPIGALLTAATGPILLIGLGLMLYNALRFENPFEFGVRYMLGPSRLQLDKIPFFSLPYEWFNLRVYFLEPARWSSRFPFVHRIVVPPLPLGRGQVETPYGVLSNIPLVWLALTVPLAWRGRSASECSILRWFLAGVALVFGANTFVVCLFRFAHFRYEVDFLPALVLLAVVGILGLERCLAERLVRRRAARWGWGLLLGFSVAFNLLAGVENYARAYCFMGSALARAGKMQEALGRYERALRIVPDSTEAQCYMGNALLLAGKIQEAIVYYEQALRSNSDSAEAHNNLGVALARAGRFQEAVEHCEEALRIKPDYVEAHFDLGDTLLRMGRVTEAIGHCEEALRMNPGFAQAHNSLGVALQHAGKLQDAIGHYEQALRMKPDYAEAHYNLGVALEQAGRVQEAIRHYQQALQIKPDVGDAQNRLARLPAVQ